MQVGLLAGNFLHLVPEVLLGRRYNEKVCGARNTADGSHSSRLP